MTTILFINMIVFWLWFWCIVFNSLDWHSPGSVMWSVLARMFLLGLAASNTIGWAAHMGWLNGKVC